MDSDSESVEWMNSFIQRFWEQFENDLSNQIKSTLDPILASSKPSFLEDLSLTVFTLGSSAPRIESIKTLIPRGDAKESVDDMLVMDWLLSFIPVDEDSLNPREKLKSEVRQSKIQVVAKIGKGVAVIPLPVLVEELEFQAKLRVGIKFQSSSPYIKLIEYSFVETPKIDFVLRPLKALDMMDMPALSRFLQETLESVLSGYVEPNKNYFDLDAFMQGSDAGIIHLQTSDYFILILFFC